MGTNIFLGSNLFKSRQKPKLAGGGGGGVRPWPGSDRIWITDRNTDQYAQTRSEDGVRNLRFATTNNGLEAEMGTGFSFLARFR